MNPTAQGSQSLLRPSTLRAGSVVALLLAWESLARFEVVNPLTLPPASEVAGVLLTLIPTAEFASDLARTSYTVGVGFGLGAAAGLVVGFVFWRWPRWGDVFEPLLATLYAVPLVIFYPILLALLGLGSPPIIAIASVMAFVPIALNTMVALQPVNPILPKLARSVNCSRAQALRFVMIPGAVPIAFSGLKLGLIFAVIGTIAMEFILAARGLGFRIGFNYQNFATAEMYAHILVVAAIAMLINGGFTYGERRLRRDMS